MFHMERDKTGKTSVVKTEKQTNRTSIDPAVCASFTSFASQPVCFRTRLCGYNKEVAASVATSTLNYSFLPALTAFAITSLGLLPLTL